jgi:hypothetical protein
VGTLLGPGSLITPREVGYTPIWVKFPEKNNQVGPLSPLAIWVGGLADTFTHGRPQN